MIAYHSHVLFLRQHGTRYVVSYLFPADAQTMTEAIRDQGIAAAELSPAILPGYYDLILAPTVTTPDERATDLETLIK
jgi:hypothetical protein